MTIVVNKLESSLSQLGAQLDATQDRVVKALMTRLDEITSLLQKKITGEKLEGNPIKSHTHKLSSSVRKVPVTNDGSRISGSVAAGGGPALYAKYLEFGTRPHDIVPVTKKDLMFFIDQKQHFAKIVHHPGTQAYHFMASTLDEKREWILSSLKEAVADALNQDRKG